jgi:amidase
MTKPGNEDICRLSAVDLAEAIRLRRLSVRQVVSAFLHRIERLNPAVNAIVSLRPARDILAEADAMDRALAAGVEPGPLYGLPMAVKDLAQTRGLRTTFGSPIFADFVPLEDDIFVERMRAAGAILIGKTNVPEFGFGSQTYNPVFGPTRNAFDPALTSGGSSGGAAVALALDMVPLADGSDMGGSLRNPAAWNGIFGMRPSQGRVPAGPSSESFLSQMGIEGPMARTVRDLALLLSVQAGYDPRAPLSLDNRPDFMALVEQTPAKPRIAWLGDLAGHLPVEGGILALCEAALALLGDAGAVVESHMPDFDYEAAWQAFVTLRHATSGAALRVHYDDTRTRPLLKPEARWEVEGSLGLTADRIYAASQVRTAWHAALLRLFERFDYAVLPTAQVFPFPVDTHWPAEVAGRKMDSYHRWMEVTAFATLAGCPAVNVPVGFDAKGRPMGMQVIGRPRDDAAVLQIARLCEQVFPWVGTKPPQG